MKRNYRKLALALTICLCVFCGGAGAFALSAGEPTDADTGERTLKEVRDETFFIGSYVNFHNTRYHSLEEQLRDLKACGINLVTRPNEDSTIERDQFGFMWDPHDKEKWLEFDKLCEKYDMWYMSDAPSSGLSMAETVEITKDLKRCIAYHLTDEPSYVWLEPWGEISRQYQEADPERDPYINLFGIYLDQNTLGGSYENYLQKYIDVTNRGSDYLSYDFYPFNSTSTNTSQYFENLEVVRKVALRNNQMKVNSFLQTGQWKDFMRVPNEKEVRWQTYTSLAYGQKMLNLFCYQTPAWVSVEDGGEEMRNHCVDWDGTKLPLYYDCQNVFSEARVIGQTLMGYECQVAYQTTDKYMGTTALPSDFVVNPQGSSDLTISYFTGHEEGDPDYLMIVNNSFTDETTERFTVDPIFSGIEGMEYLNPFTEEYEKVDLSDGGFQRTFRAGEGMLFRLTGDVNISLELSEPSVSLKSGEYVGPQTVVIQANSRKEKIYYTLDGSYPTSASTPYTGPIRIGKEGESEQVTLRTVTASGKNSSPCQTFYYYITKSSKNARRNAAPTAEVWMNLPWESYGGTDSVLENLTDGNADERSVATLSGSRGWLYLDLGKSCVLDTLELQFAAGLSFDDVIVQAGEDVSFLGGTHVVYNSDRDNSYGMGIGGDIYAETAEGELFSVDCKGVSARYLRITNMHAGRSIFGEIKVFVREGSLLENRLTVDGEGWSGTGWSTAGGVLSQPAGGNYLSAITYTNGKFKDFLLEASVRFDGDAPTGYLGFELRKTRIEDNEDTVGGTGITVAIQPDGSVYAIKNLFVYGTPGRIPDFDPNEWQHIRITAIGNLISVWVNGNPVYSCADDELAGEAGYLAFHGGTAAVSAKDVFADEQRVDCTLYTPEAVAYAKTLDGAYTVKKAVDRFTHYSQILSELPERMVLVDTAGASHTVDVTWYCENYDRSQVGTNFNFHGVLSGLPAGVENVSGYEALAVVFVKYETDYTLLLKYMELASSLNEQDYTPESWETFAYKYQSCQDAYVDPYLTPSNVNLLYTQLRAEYLKLERVGADKTALRELVEESVEEDSYTSASVAAWKSTVSDGRRVAENLNATKSEIDQAAAAIRNAKRALVLKGDRELVLQKLTELAGLDRSLYTAKSLARFDAVVAGIARASRGELSQDSVSRFSELLDAAEQELKVKA